MNKKILLIAGGVIVLLAVGYFFMKPKTQDLTGTPNVFISVKDALSKNLSLVCDFKDEKGQITKSYIKNGAVRVSTTDGKQASEIIILKDKMYMWDEKTKMGFVYPIKTEDQTSKVGMTGTEVTQSETYLGMIEKYKDSCKTSIVSDSLFTPPTDVKLQDMSKLLEDLQKQIPTVPTQP